MSSSSISKGSVPVEINNSTHVFKHKQCLSAENEKITVKVWSVDILYANIYC